MFFINKKMCLQKMMSSGSENVKALVLIITFVTQKTKKIKKTKIIRMKPWLKKTIGKSAYVNIFSEFLLTEKYDFHQYLRMNTTSYY